MATYEKKLVTNPFHLELEQYKKLFPEIKPRMDKVLIVGLDPLVSLSGIFVQNKEEKDNKVKESMIHKGFMVIAVGDADACKDIKEGDFVMCPFREAVEYSLKREIYVKDVFPRIRKYTVMLVASHACSAFIKPDLKLISKEREVNVDAEEQLFEEYQSNVNKIIDESV